MTPDEIFKKCAELRKLQPELMHRVYYDFGRFIQECVDYYVFGKLPTDKDIGEFLSFYSYKRLHPPDPKNFNDYLKLFLRFYEYQFEVEVKER